MSETHWRKLINPDYLGAYSLDSGNGTYRTAVFTITSAEQKDVAGPDGTKKKLVLELKESNKPMILNSTNARTLEKLFKTAYIERWIGRQFEVGVESVRVGPSKEDALRIRKYLPRAVSETVKYACSDCSSEIKAFGGKTAAGLAEYTTSKYGKALCSDCATKAAAVPVEAAE